MPRLSTNDGKGCQSSECDQHFRRMEDHIAFLDKRMVEQFGQAQRELDRTAAVLDKRLTDGNHVRDTLKDQNALTLTRKEHEFYAQKVDNDIRMLRESKAEIAGKASQSNLNAVMLIAIVGALTGVLTLALTLMGRLAH